MQYTIYSLDVFNSFQSNLLIFILQNHCHGGDNPQRKIKTEIRNHLLTKTQGTNNIYRPIKYDKKQTILKPLAVLKLLKEQLILKKQNQLIQCAMRRCLSLVFTPTLASNLVFKLVEANLL